MPSLLKSSYFTDRTRPLVLAGPDAGNDFPPLAGFLSSLLGPGQGAFRYLSGYLDGSGDLVRLERRTLDYRSRNPAAGLWRRWSPGHRPGSHARHVPALAYRVEYRGRSLVFSGDQKGGDAQFVDFARGADLLVMVNAVPEDTGPVAARLHVLSHLMRRSEQAMDRSLAACRT